MNTKISLKSLMALFLIMGITAGLTAFFGYFSAKPMTIDVNTLKKRTNLIPVAIIGSGPAGLTSGIYGARSGIPTYIFEGNKPGGLLTETTEVENWPGETLILGPDLINKMHQQAQDLGVTFVADTIESIDTSQWPYMLTLESGVQVHALSVIIATGATPRRLGIPGESEYWGYGVTTCAVCDAPFRKGQDVIVIGGGDSAVEEAIQLAPHARTVTIMVRKDHMRAAARMQDRLRGYNNIKIRFNVDVKEVIGEQVEGQFGPIKRVTAVRVYDNKTNEEFIMNDIRGVFLAIGHIPNSQLFCEHIECDDNGYIKPQGRSQKTSLRGIFVAGDVADHVYRQAITSAGFGCMAMLDAAAFLGDIEFTDQLAEDIEAQMYYPETLGESTVLQPRTMQELKHIIAESKKPVIVDFYGDLCPSCLQMLPVYNRVAGEMADEAIFVKVNVDEAEDIVKHFNVLTVPCIMAITDGKPQKPAYRTMRRKELMSFVEAASSQQK